ncbi:MAG: hypothetical protein ACRD20_02690 [Terriglobales bacterium]
MDSTIHPPKWTPYEVKAAEIHYERRTEKLQLEQLLKRLQKKMQEAELRSALESSAA